MRKSKLLTVLVAAAIGVSMVGCGSSGGSSSSGSGGSSSGGDVANKDKPLCWYNRQPSNSSTGELDKTALTFNDKTYYVGFDANQGAELQGQMVLEYIKKNIDKIDRNGDGVIGYVLAIGDIGHNDSIARTCGVRSQLGTAVEKDGSVDSSPAGTNVDGTSKVVKDAKLEVNGKENIPNQACLFVANHISFFDIVVTYPLMISPTGYIAKKELEKVPFLSWIMRFVNCIFLDRKDPRNGLKAVLSAADMIKSGISVFLFPEGTRSKTGKMGEFKDGGFKIATKSKAPVVPVGITGTNDILENHFPFIKSGKVIVSFGKPIYTTDMDRAEQKLLPGKAYEQVKKLSNQL